MTGNGQRGSRRPSEAPDSTAWATALRSRLHETPLIDFALALYAREGVEAACLTLQDDAGLDVCEVLWHVWLYHHGARLIGDPPELAELHRWQREVTQPLRALRRRLKAQAHGDAGVAGVRRDIKRAELAAEYHALALLQRLGERTTRLEPLSKPPPPLSSTLAARWQVQKKSQLMALQTLESRLDPP
ncbi:TIGR02444 family protein [Billgrantia gudaonensis]|uniref:TIGR02444 family protein n=1 Tax=Billgrantia gudaonensis TaxID=376427 RepID=A0A1G8YFC1_9GAMM|nr:TIGR02444 family protein [Halomonas gudaonensis]SDK01528.1 TIGR02444 family protein [Halomonas gudaonensis]